MVLKAGFKSMSMSSISQGVGVEGRLEQSKYLTSARPNVNTCPLFYLSLQSSDLMFTFKAVQYRPPQIPEDLASGTWDLPWHAKRWFHWKLSSASGRREQC